MLSFTCRVKSSLVSILTLSLNYVGGFLFEWTNYMWEHFSILDKNKKKGSIFMFLPLRLSFPCSQSIIPIIGDNGLPHIFARQWYMLCLVGFTQNISYQ